MRVAAVLRALGPIDARSVRRDMLLRWMLVLPLGLALIVRWGKTAVARWLESAFEVDLFAYAPLIGTLLVLATPIVFGNVIGFLLLDQKDDRTLSALQVTPLSPAGYLAYRIGLPMAISVGMTVVALQIGGVTQAGLGRQFLSALGAAPLAPAMALFLAGFARNKVQGFALMKGAGALNWPPMIAWFVAPPLQWWFGLCPTYWPARIYWDLEPGGGGAWVSLPLGTLLLALLNLLLLRRYERTLQR